MKRLKISRIAIRVEAQVRLILNHVEFYRNSREFPKERSWRITRAVTYFWLDISEEPTKFHSRNVVRIEMQLHFYATARRRSLRRALVSVANFRRGIILTPETAILYLLIARRERISFFPA